VSYLTLKAEQVKLNFQWQIGRKKETALVMKTSIKSYKDSSISANDINV